MGRLLLTGANGFIGRAVARIAADRGWKVRAALRHPAANFPTGTETVVLGPFSSNTQWEVALRGVDAVIHCAARVHVIHEQDLDPLDAYRQVNVDATLHLARAAAKAGVRRFVFLSSIGVNGSVTHDNAFTAFDTPTPKSHYAQSKREAELGLLALRESFNLEPVIIRPPLVYGPKAPGNFARLVNALRRGLPLPLALVRNRRSFVAVDNLADLVVVCADHPQAAGEVFLVSDGEDLSTVDWLRRTASAFGTHARLFPVPLPLLQWGAKCVGREATFEQLCGSLVVDITKTREILGWTPQVSIDEALRRTARYYLEQDTE